MNSGCKRSDQQFGKLKILIAGKNSVLCGTPNYAETSSAAFAALTDSALTRKLTAAALEIYLGHTPTEEELAGEQRQPGGKPFFPAYPDFHYNISHSGGIAVCAISDHPVGIDLQKLPEDPRKALKIAKRFFSREEQDSLSALAGCDHADTGQDARADNASHGNADALCRLFCRYWTSRESYIKLTGKGLAEPFSDYRPDLEAGAIRILRPDQNTDIHRTACLTECPAPPGFCLTVCSDVPLPPCTAEFI